MTVEGSVAAIHSASSVATAQAARFKRDALSTSESYALWVRALPSLPASDAPRSAPARYQRRRYAVLF
jgi:hypothetical protein